MISLICEWSWSTARGISLFSTTSWSVSIFSHVICFFHVGLFSPSFNETWTSEITNWQPLPIHTVPHNLDNLLVRGNNCPRYNAMCLELWTTRPTPEVVVEETKYAEFWQMVKRNASRRSIFFSAYKRSWHLRNVFLYL